MSGWTLETLKEHFDQRFSDQDRAVTAALEAAKEATTKAENAADKRFDAANEFRGQLADQASHFMPRTEAEQRLGVLEAAYSRQTGKEDGIGRFGVVLISLGSLLVAAASVAIALFR